MELYYKMLGHNSQVSTLKEDLYHVSKVDLQAVVVMEEGYGKGSAHQSSWKPSIISGRSAVL